MNPDLSIFVQPCVSLKTWKVRQGKLMWREEVVGSVKGIDERKDGKQEGKKDTAWWNKNYASKI